MKLTREQAIAEHRKMWLWISRQIMKDYTKYGKVETIYQYKVDYSNMYCEGEIIRSKCFCCEYVAQIDGMCMFNCPLWWNDKNTIRTCCEEEGYYEILNNIVKDEGYSLFHSISEHDAKRAARMAYKIAMLDEKEKNK